MMKTDGATEMAKHKELLGQGTQCQLVIFICLKISEVNPAVNPLTPLSLCHSVLYIKAESRKDIR